MHLLAILTAMAVFCTQLTYGQDFPSQSPYNTSPENVVTIIPHAFIPSGKAKFEINKQEDHFFGISVTLVNNTFSDFQGVLVKSNDGTAGDWPFPIYASQTYSSALPAGTYYVHIFRTGTTSGPHTYSYNTGASSGSYTGSNAQFTNVTITSAITLTVHN